MDDSYMGKHKHVSIDILFNFKKAVPFMS
jgi:hypothetical protein